MKLKVKVKQPSKPNATLYSTKDWGIYIANKCFDDGYRLNNLKLQYLLYFVYKFFKDKNIRIFYDDVKDTDWVCKQGFPKFFNAYYRLTGYGIMKVHCKLKEEIDLTNSVFRKDVDDIIKHYVAKDIYVLDTLFKQAEGIDEKQQVIDDRIRHTETGFNYDKEHDLLYVKLKNCPNYYVDQLEDRYFDLWRDSETDEVVGAHIWNASEWFRTVLKTVEANSMDKEEKNELDK